MAENGRAGEEEAARLEAALDRIAKSMANISPQRGVPQTMQGAEVAGRLDALIAEIRAALGRDSAS
jgi:hypothetical protein